MIKRIKKKPEPVTETEVKSLRKVKEKPQTIRSYVVGLTLLKFRQNLLIRVRANNDYYAILEAMGKFTLLQSAAYPEKAGYIEDSWEAEKARLISRCKDFEALHNYLCMIGFVVSKPLIIKEDESLKLDRRTEL